MARAATIARNPSRGEFHYVTGANWTDPWEVKTPAIVRVSIKHARIIFEAALQDVSWVGIPALVVPPAVGEQEIEILATNGGYNPMTWQEFLDFLPALPTRADELLAVTEEEHALQLAAEAGFDIPALRRLALRAHGRASYVFGELVAALQRGAHNSWLAEMAGVENCSYDTVRYGTVASYRGEGVVTFPNGEKWRVEGYGPSGDPQQIYHKGGVRWKRAA